MKKEEIVCQVDTYKTEPLNRSIIEILGLVIKDVMRRSRQNLISFLNIFKKKESSSPLSKDITTLNLQKGERVFVKSREEILKTIDADGKLQGCAFTKEMWSLCGKEAIVFKRVDTFLNETNNKIQKISNTVLLENSFCGGERSFSEVCDRACFLFWKEAWLQRISSVD